MSVVEYLQGAKFPGKIGRTAEESSPAWPQPVRAKGGARNVLFFTWLRAGLQKRIREDVEDFR